MKDKLNHPGPATAAEPATMIGPFETHRQARETPAVRAAWDAAHASDRRGIMGERNHQMLSEACAAAGVKVGAYDAHILRWLAGWEPETCAVLAGIISRAAAGPAVPRDGGRFQRLQALEDAIKWRRARVAVPCGECAASGDRCDDHGRDRDLISEYESAARRLGAGEAADA